MASVAIPTARAISDWYAREYLRGYWLLSYDGKREFISEEKMWNGGSL
jgi:hypothetical protein